MLSGHTLSYTEHNCSTHRMSWWTFWPYCKDGVSIQETSALLQLEALLCVCLPISDHRTVYLRSNGMLVAVTELVLICFWCKLWVKQLIVSTESWCGYVITPWRVIELTFQASALCDTLHCVPKKFNCTVEVNDIFTVILPVHVYMYSICRAHIPEQLLKRAMPSN